MFQVEINTKKNLLAFSGGIDSTALFFILLEKNIPFDIAIVDYNIRSQSKKEVSYAKELAKEYNKKCYLKELNLDSSSNFEKKARDERYDFFEELIKNNSYETLLTAHQLNDKLEWFLMQFSKGAGLIELIGLDELSYKNSYKIQRPLLNYSKNQLQNYLDKKGIKYFIDGTNSDTKYKRNYFRKNFSNAFLEEFEEGVKKSFKYLSDDINSLNIEFKALKSIYELDIFEANSDENINIKVIDKNLKKRGVLLSKSQRDEILRQKELTISHKINIAITKEYIYICPKTKTSMPKKFKEECRVKKIPKNIRPYLFEQKVNLKDLIL